MWKAFNKFNEGRSYLENKCSLLTTLIWIIYKRIIILRKIIHRWNMLGGKKLTKKSIDMLFEAYERKDNRYFSELLDIEEKDINWSDWHSTSKLYMGIAKKLSKPDDWKYFLSQKHTNINFFINILRFSSDIKEIKKIVKEGGEFLLNPSDITELIIATNERKYLENCILNREKLKLGSSCIVKIIIAIDDIEYTKKCIKNRDNLRLGSYHIYKLIEATKNREYIKECVDNRNKLKLCSFYVAKLINATHDKVYINNYINNGKKMEIDSYIITKLINDTQNIGYIKKCIENKEKLGISSADVAYLIKETNNNVYIKKCIEDWKSIGLSASDITSLIIEVNSKDYTKKIIKNSTKYGLKSSDIVKILITTGNREYIKECVCRAKKLNLSVYDIKNLIMATNDPEYIKMNYKLNNKDLKNKISLPEDMTIGIEIESVGLYSKKINGFTLKSKKWEAKEDETVKGTLIGEDDVEVISPILTGSNKNVTEEIIMITKLLNALGQHTNDSCGGHIHIGASYLKSTMSMLNLLEIWVNVEYIIYLISNEKGKIPRGIEYMNPISGDLENALKNKTVNLNSNLCYDEINKEIVDFQGTKGKGINFLNITPGRKKNNRV